MNANVERATRGSGMKRLSALALVVLAVACSGKSVTYTSDSMSKAGESATGTVAETTDEDAPDMASTGGTGNTVAVPGTAGTGGYVAGTRGKGWEGGGYPNVGDQDRKEMCSKLQSTESCRSAGCHPIVSDTWSRDGGEGGGGGVGGATPETCTVHEEVLVHCSDQGSGGAVSLACGCDAACNSCTCARTLPVGWIGGVNDCYWRCEDGLVKK